MEGNTGPIESGQAIATSQAGSLKLSEEKKENGFLNSGFGFVHERNLNPNLVAVAAPAMAPIITDMTILATITATI